MKEIIAVVRMNRTNATKKALIESGAAGFTALKVMGRGKLVEDKGLIAARKANMMEMAIGEDAKEAEELIDGFLDGQRLFPRRMFHVIAKNQDVDRSCRRSSTPIEPKTRSATEKYLCCRLQK